MQIRNLGPAYLVSLFRIQLEQAEEASFAERNEFSVGHDG